MKTSAATNEDTTVDTAPHSQLKYLNYPLQKVTCRSLVDADGVYRPSIYSTNSHAPRKVPVYVRYCIDLILGEIGEGDLMLARQKCKYVRDLPMVLVCDLLASTHQHVLTRRFFV